MFSTPPIFRDFIFHPLFIAGLVIRLLSILIFDQYFAETLYIPFLEFTTQSFYFDPWAAWSSVDGNISAFPYGYAMWLIFYVFFTLASLINIPSEVAYYLVLMIAEVAVLTLLVISQKRNRTSILLLFWLSPVALLVSYIYGLNDILPIAFVFGSLFALHQQSWRLGGALLALGISVKLTMLVALPIFILYFVNAPTIRKFFKPFFASFAIIFIIITLPFILSRAAFNFVSSNSELEKLTSVAFTLGEVEILVVPLLYLFALYWIWRRLRINFDALLTYVGLVFLAFALFVPTAPGWFLWSLPIIVLYQSKSNLVTKQIGGIFALFFCIAIIYLMPVSIGGNTYSTLISMDALSSYLPIPHGDVLFTIMVGIGLLMGWRMWREKGVSESFFSKTGRALMIGIAGDSGTGKDTLAETIIEGFGKQSAQNISGDDYHKYDRTRGVWNVMTHLHPLANYLESFYLDISRLRNRQAIYKRHYDHDAGILGALEQAYPSDFVIVSGLHAFMSDKLSSLYDLKIYLDMDDELRRFYKIERDTKKRGKTIEATLAAMEKRQADYETYVRPQIDKADLVFSLKSAKPLAQVESVDNIVHELIVRMRVGQSLETFTRVFMGLLGSDVLETVDTVSGVTNLHIKGEFSSGDIEFAAQQICPEMSDYLDVPAEWKAGMLGVMQILVLVAVSDILELSGHANVK